MKNSNVSFMSQSSKDVEELLMSDGCKSIYTIKFTLTLVEDLALSYQT